MPACSPPQFWSHATTGSRGCCPLIAAPKRFVCSLLPSVKIETSRLLGSAVLPFRKDCKPLNTACCPMTLSSMRRSTGSVGDDLWRFDLTAYCALDLEESILPNIESRKRSAAGRITGLYHGTNERQIWDDGRANGQQRDYH